jgi:hypothetical protein
MLSAECAENQKNQKNQESVKTGLIQLKQAIKESFKYDYFFKPKKTPTY